MFADVPLDNMGLCSLLMKDILMLVLARTLCDPELDIADGMLGLDISQPRDERQVLIVLLLVLRLNLYVSQL